MNTPSHNRPDLTPLLTVAEVASYLQVSIRTVRRLIVSGELKVIRIGRAIRVQKTALRAFIASGTRG